jgi:hypothetical protein
MDPEQLEQAYAVIKGQLAIANAERDKAKVRPRARRAAVASRERAHTAPRTQARNVRADALRDCAARRGVP